MLAVIIPNYNGIEHLRTCFASLKEQTYRDFTTILVDNGSMDDSVNYANNYGMNIHIISLNENNGFAKAVNLGIKHALSDSKIKYILLLNNDIELDKDFIKHGIEALNSSGEVYFTAAKMLNYYERDRIDDCGDFIKSNGGSPYARGHGEKDEGQYDDPEYIFGACAGAAFYKREFFEKVGYFEEDFFAYYEDIDISFRAQISGLKCLYYPKSVCYHKRGGTSSIATHGFQTMMCERNLILMRFRNYPLMLYLLYQPVFILARTKRYYSFLRYHGFNIFWAAVKGYFMGLLALPGEIKNRSKIQKKRIMPASLVKKLFS